MSTLFPLPKRKRLGLKDMLRVASSKSEFKKGCWDGYRTSTGRIYLMCLFHKERTPSLVVYRREPVYALRPIPVVEGNLDWTEWKTLGPRDKTKFLRHRSAHFHCYGCGQSGSYSTLLRHIKRIHADAELLAKYREAKKFATGCIENDTGELHPLPF